MGKNHKNNISTKDKIPEAKARGNNMLYLYGALTFLLSFSGYLLTLAPSVTFEDSGELIVAARYLGVPHQPGYPLFTIIGWLFSWLPFGDVAYRLNLMSAFFSAVAASLVYFSTVFLIEDTFSGNKRKKHINEIPDIFIYLIGVLSGLMFAFSFENWEQSIITEVYGLHGFFVSLFILLVILLKRSKDETIKRNYIYWICFITGLALTNHTTALLFIPVFAVFMLIHDTKLLLDLKVLGKSLLFGFAGLLPLLYLPISSSFDPVMDWGNPENWTNFIRVISRHQYTDLAQTSEKFASGLSFYFAELLTGQWNPFLLLLLIPSIIALFRYNRSMFYFSLLFLVFYIPVTTYLTDFDVRGEGYIANLNRLLVTVFYIPSYLYVALLFGFGAYYLITLLRNRLAQYALTGLVLLMFVISFSGNYSRVSMRNFHYTQHYLENLFNVVDENALVFTQIDYYYFPVLYYQYIEDKRRDVTVLDRPLLKRSWYIEMLKNNHPSLINQSKTAVDEFLKAVEPFENNEPHDGNYIEKKYIGMINSFIDHAIDNGEDVYFTYLPQKNILRSYTFEPMLGAYRLTRQPEVTDIKYSIFNFENFIRVDENDPFLVRTFSQYYGELHISRGVLYEQLGREEEALKLYRKGLQFYFNNTKVREYAEMRINYLISNNKRNSRDLE